MSPVSRAFHAAHAKEKFFMNATFTPHLEILPVAQRRLWPALRPLPDLGFILYRGTAIALRLGHRQSVDFDFFSAKPLCREALSRRLPLVRQGETIQEDRDTWTVLVRDDADENVKFSFFGNISFGRVGGPDYTDDGVLLVASLQDLLANKVKVILQRAEAKDYRDICAMLNAGGDLAAALAAAELLFAPGFQPAESLRALTFFEDGDLPSLTDAEKRQLQRAAVAVQALPPVRLAAASFADEEEPLPEPKGPEGQKA